MNRGRWAGLGLVLAALVPPSGAGAAELYKMVFIHGAGVNDVTFSHITAGQHLGYYEQEGISLQVESAMGSGAAVQALAAGKAQAGSTTHVLLLQPAANGTDLDLVTVYTYLPRHFYSIVVRPESPITEVRQLAGKRIGVPNMAASSRHYAKAMIREVGGDPESVAFAAVGFGVSAAKALADGAVDALAIWDVVYAAMENQGYKLKYLPVPKEFDRLSGPGVSVKREYLKTNRRQVVGFLRGIAKSSRFALANPEAALRIHWKLYPETRPKGMSQEEAFRQAMHIQNTRLSRVGIEGRAVRKWGYTDDVDWAKTVEVFGLQSKIPDVKKFYTNELIDEANTFDPRVVERDARTFRIE